MHSSHCQSPTRTTCCKWFSSVQPSNRSFIRRWFLEDHQLPRWTRHNQHVVVLESEYSDFYSPPWNLVDRVILTKIRLQWWTKESVPQNIQSAQGNPKFFWLVIRYADCIQVYIHQNLRFFQAFLSSDNQLFPFSREIGYQQMKDE